MSLKGCMLELSGMFIVNEINGISLRICEFTDVGKENNNDFMGKTK